MKIPRNLNIQVKNRSNIDSLNDIKLKSITYFRLKSQQLMNLWVLNFSTEGFLSIK